VEPSAANLYQRSEDFANVYWAKTNCAVPSNQAIAPDNTLTAGKLIMGNGISPTIINQSGLYRSEVVASSAYRFSIFAKSAEFTGFKVRETVVEGAFLDVNLSNGAITNGSVAQFISPLAENYGNGWYRISWTSPAITNLTKYVIRVGSTGDGVSGIFVWGAQYETGTVPTSYIPTTTQAITRAADVIRKTSITSLIGQSEGTIYFEVEVTSEVRDRWICTLDSAANSFIQMVITTNRTILVSSSNGGPTVMSSLISSVLSVGYHKVAFAYNTATNGCIMYIDGVQNPVLTRTVVAPGLPALNDMSVGNFRTSNTDTLKARIRAGLVYPNRLSNSELATLTTP
jgi:hypothetical protein